MNFSTTSADESFLASPAELVGLLAQLAALDGRQCSQKQRDARAARQAISRLFPDSLCPDELSRHAPARPAPAQAGTHAPRPAKARPAQRVAIATTPRNSVQRKEGVSRGRQRQYCDCGQCCWCLDNARWDRIFEEKFADPSYYGTLIFKHNSSLGAGAGA